MVKYYKFLWEDFQQPSSLKYLFSLRIIIRLKYKIFMVIFFSKGSVFVTFETSDQMKAFLAQESPKYQDSALTLESQYVLFLKIVNYS